MVAPPPNPNTTSNLLSTQSSLIQTLCSFLTVSIHHILYLRGLYPRISFLSTRAYNFPARQNRHPAVCNWIISAVDAIRDQLEKNTVEKVAIYIFEVERNVVLEKWTFDLSALPIVEKADRDIPFERQVGGNDDTEERFSTKINIADLEAQFRAVLNRISAANDRLSALPSDPECSFTVSIEIRDDADRPVGRLEKEERKWIPAEPEPWNENEDQRGDSHAGSSEGTKMAVSENKSRTVAVRRLEAGELRMEVWVEESGAKLAQKKIP